MEFSALDEMKVRILVFNTGFYKIYSTFNYKYSVLCFPWLSDSFTHWENYWEATMYKGLFRMLCTCSDDQSCPNLCDAMDHEIFQARILVWVAISSFRGSSWSRDQTHVSCIPCIGRWSLYHWATWEALSDAKDTNNKKNILSHHKKNQCHDKTYI